MKSDSKKGKVVLSKSVTVDELPDESTAPEITPEDQAVVVEPEVIEAEVEESETAPTEEIKTEVKVDKTEEAGRPEEVGKIIAEEKPQKTHHKQWRPSRRTGIIAGSVTLAVVALWFASGLFLSKTSVGNTQLSSRSSNEQLKSEIEKQVNDYRLSINYPDGTTKKYELQTMGVTLNPDISVQATRSQQKRLNRWATWWTPVEAQLVFDENSDKLNEFITKEIDVPVQPSKDASLTIENGTIKLTESVSGISYKLKDPEAVLRKATRTLQTDAIKLEKLTKDPELSAELLQPYKESLEKTLNQPIKFTIGDKKITPSTADIASWLDITPANKEKKLLITVNSGKVVEYINKIAANAIRPPRSQVIVKKADGSEQVIVEGVRGLDVLNKGDVATTISKTLLDNKGIEASLPVSYAPYKTISTGYYPKWIEADVTNKRLYVHEYTETIKTLLISAGAPATPTVTGQYTIGSKIASQDMRGRNVDGSNYFQPRVPYVMYFYNDYAIHGNYWRPLSYFGNINSSHGCIGLTTADSAWLYNWAPKGTPVVVYK